MISKKIKLELITCCVCNNSGYSNFTDAFNVFLRENEIAMSFAEVINFTLGIRVSKELSSMCEKCKLKVIEFYNLKKQAQAVRGQTMIQEIMKIVSSFTSKNNLTAVTIEESCDKLVIMEKSSSATRAEPSNSNNLIITNVFENVDFKVEKDDDDSENISRIQIKTEKQDDEEEAQPPDLNYYHQIINGVSTPSADDKMDLILGLNQEILRLVKQLTDKNEQNITTKEI